MWMNTTTTAAATTGLAEHLKLVLVIPFSILLSRFALATTGATVHLMCASLSALTTTTALPRAVFAQGTTNAMDLTIFVARSVRTTTTAAGRAQLAVVTTSVTKHTLILRPRCFCILLQLSGCSREVDNFHKVIHVSEFLCHSLLTKIHGRTHPKASKLAKKHDHTNTVSPARQCPTLCAPGSQPPAS